MTDWPCGICGLYKVYAQCAEDCPKFKEWQREQAKETDGEKGLPK